MNLKNKTLQRTLSVKENFAPKSNKHLDDINKNNEPKNRNNNSNFNSSTTFSNGNNKLKKSNTLSNGLAVEHKKNKS